MAWNRERPKQPSASANDAKHISSRAALGSLAFGFAAFVIVLPKGRDAEAAGQELFLVSLNLLPLAAIAFAVSFVCLRLGRFPGLHVSMGLLLALFVLGLLGLFAQVGDLQSKMDRIYAWVMLVSGSVQIGAHWVIALVMRWRRTPESA